MSDLCIIQQESLGLGFFFYLSFPNKAGWEMESFLVQYFIAMTAMKLFKRRILVLVLKNAISALWSFVPAEALEGEMR